MSLKALFSTLLLAHDDRFMYKYLHQTINYEAPAIKRRLRKLKALNVRIIGKYEIGFALKQGKFDYDN